MCEREGERGREREREGERRRVESKTISVYSTVEIEERCYFQSRQSACNTRELHLTQTQDHQVSRLALYQLTHKDSSTAGGVVSQAYVLVLARGTTGEVESKVKVKE